MDNNDFAIEDAVRSKVGLFIGLAGGTGSGKTYTAMRLASGIVGPGNKFGVICTENKRSLHYADEFKFSVIHLTPPYSSERYEKAVLQLFNAGYGAIVIDSGSHEHDGHGGYLDMQAHDLEERVKRYMSKNTNAQEWQVIEKLTPSSWIKPKQARKKMNQTILSCSSTIPIIYCFRAEEKVFASKDGKLVARPVPEWEPICGKGLPFEMTVFFMLAHDKPGYVLKAIKLPAKLSHIFPTGKQIGEEAGRMIAEWGKGSDAPPPSPEDKKGTPPEPPGENPPITVGELKTKLSGMMTGLNQESKVLFYSHVMSGKVETIDNLQDFIDNFKEKREAYLNINKE